MGFMTISMPHQPSPDCWCHPVEIEPGIWVHHADTQVLPNGSSDPFLDAYVPDIKGVIQGDES